MKRRAVIVGVVFLVAVLATWFSASSEPIEPDYQGRRLSVWLDQRAQASRSGEIARLSESDQAVRAVGAEATPVLLAWIDRSGSVAGGIVEKLQRGLNLPTFVRTTQDRKRAVQGFLALGPAARPAFPKLVDLALRSTDLGQRQDAVMALRLADASALRLVAAGLNDPDPLIRLHAVEALGCLPIAPGEVSIPALERAKADPDGLVAAEATRILAITPQNLANLATWLSSPDPMIRTSGIVQLASYQTRAKDYLPRLETALQDPDPAVRQSAAAAIEQIRGKPTP